MIKTLIKGNRYNGRYVAMRDFDDSRVIGYGDTAQEAFKKAVKKGYNNPVVVFVPLKGMAQIY
ncbi:MAG: DUF5678 domain-containing protein [Candidatus Omnitrophica bacterium]|nr:DUF5678 domain-containing protein [Candidatus Omnitrophota bacterium]